MGDKEKRLQTQRIRSGIIVSMDLMNPCRQLKYENRNHGLEGNLTMAFRRAPLWQSKRNEARKKGCYSDRRGEGSQVDRYKGERASANQRKKTESDVVTRFVTHKV